MTALCSFYNLFSTIKAMTGSKQHASNALQRELTHPTVLIMKCAALRRYAAPQSAEVPSVSLRRM